MTKEQAIALLKQVAVLAQSRGILKLEDANTVLMAFKVLEPKEEPKKEEKKK